MFEANKIHCIQKSEFFIYMYLIHLHYLDLTKEYMDLLTSSWDWPFLRTPMLSTCEQVDSFPSPLPSLELLYTHLGLFCLAGICCNISKTLISKRYQKWPNHIIQSRKKYRRFFQFFFSLILKVTCTIRSIYVVTIINY